MSLLDDARRLKPHTYIGETFDDGYQEFCSECDRRLDQGHAPECSWIAYPRVVAALEAADEMHDAIRAYGQDRRSGTHDRVVDALEAWRAVAGKILET